MNTTIVIPAYGRKYKSAAEAKADWVDGLDFKIEGGPYCSNRDFDCLDVVLVRWDKNEPLHLVS